MITKMMNQEITKMMKQEITKTMNQEITKLFLGESFTRKDKKSYARWDKAYSR